jgi:hypothetical protein
MERSDPPVSIGLSALSAEGRSHTLDSNSLSSQPDGEPHTVPPH